MTAWSFCPDQVKQAIKKINLKNKSCNQQNQLNKINMKTLENGINY